MEGTRSLLHVGELASQTEVYSLIQFYPHFERTLRESLRVLVGEDVEKRVDIGMAKDGSGVGGMTSSILCPLLQLTNFPQPHCAPYKLSNNSVYLQSRCNKRKSLGSLLNVVCCIYVVGIVPALSFLISQ